MTNEYYIPSYLEQIEDCEDIFGELEEPLTSEEKERIEITEQIIRDYKAALEFEKWYDKIRAEDYEYQKELATLEADTEYWCEQYEDEKWYCG